MITTLRRLFSSKIGVALALGFLVIMGVSFAMGDVQNVSAGGTSVSQGNIARVGSEQISINAVRQRFDAAFRQAQEQQPGLTREAFAASGAFDRTVREMTELAAVRQYAASLGIAIDNATVDAIIAQNPAFAGPAGRFDENVLKGALRERGLTADDLRDEIRGSIIARQLLAPGAQVGPAPEAVADAYTAMLLERRFGRALFIPAARFAPSTPPSAQALQSYYTAQRARYALPERRVLRYAIFDPATANVGVTVTDAEVAERFRARQSDFAAQETRRFRMVIAGDRATADRIAAAAPRGGLDAAARAAGLQTSQTSATSQQQLAQATSTDAARAAYALTPRGVSAPLAVPLGFAILQLEGVDTRPARTLAQASGELRTALTTEKRRAAVAQRFNAMQDAFGGGESLRNIAQGNGLTVVETPQLTAASQSANADVEAVKQAGFGLHEGEPGTIVPIGQGEAQKFALVELAQLLPSAPPALGDIRERVVADWRLEEGNKAARARARTISQAVERGTELSAAAAASGAAGAVQPISGQRISTLGGRGVPPEIALLFTLAPGQVRTLEMPGRAGWMVIRSERAEPAPATSNPQLRQAVKAQFGQALGSEMVETLLGAARRHAPIRLDQAAVERLRRELSGTLDPNAG